jgi:hypothetical protein
MLGYATRPTSNIFPSFPRMQESSTVTVRLRWVPAFAGANG